MKKAKVKSTYNRLMKNKRFKIGFKIHYALFSFKEKIFELIDKIKNNRNNK